MGKLNILALAATVDIAIAFILIIVGFATAGWTEFGGFFETCIGSLCVDVDLVDQPDEVQATAAMVIIGFLAAFVALVCIVVFLVFGITDNMSDLAGKLPVISLVASIVGAVFTIIGCIIFAAEYYDTVDPDYSFFLALIGAIILIIGGIIAFKSKNGGVGGA